MLKKIVNFNIDNIAIFLITILPIGLLISTGVSELLSILLVILFIIKSLNEKNLRWYKNFYFLILAILWIALILNLIFSKYPENTIFRSLGFLKYIIFNYSIAYYLKIKSNLNTIFSTWTIILLIVSFDIYFEYIFKHNIFGFASGFCIAATIAFGSTSAIFVSPVIEFISDVFAFSAAAPPAAGAPAAGAAPASNNQFLKSRSDPITIDFLILVSFLYVRKHALQDIYLHVIRFIA